MSKDSDKPNAITGIQAMQGHGVHESLGFWFDAWNDVIKRRGAVLAMAWLAVVGFFAAFAPVIANGHPLIYTHTDADGQSVTTFPLFANLTAADWLLLVGVLVGVVWVALPLRSGRWGRVGAMIWASVQGALISIASLLVAGFIGRRDAPDWARTIDTDGLLGIDISIAAPAFFALFFGVVFLLLPAIDPFRRRVGVVIVTSLVTAWIACATWTLPPETWPYRAEIQKGNAEAVFTIVPWSPQQIMNDRGAQLLPPGASSETPLARSLAIDAGLLRFTRPMTETEIAAIYEGINELPLPEDERTTVRETWDGIVNGGGEVNRSNLEKDLEPVLTRFGHPFYLGTDSKGQDVMSQMLHASRLAISIGLVSTGIAVVIGVTIGSLMGYFGGFIDLALYRVVEVFMAIPVLFLLIVAAGVLPPEFRNTYVMMGIIGCFTWHSAARFTRAEFFKLRNQDFVQSARSVGLPLHSILFRHMLPNGVTPVLVDASFLIAAAILFETILSYLGLGPPDQASWGRLLSDATSDAGGFQWWLAIFPGLVIFLTVLSYNLIGEAFQMAIDPKLKKARV